MRLVNLLISALLAANAGTVLGEVPHIFSAGDVIRADEINANFSAIDNAVTGINLIPGPQGPTGPQGPVGPQGVTGPQGPVGPEGPIGPQGATGPQGPAGPEGLIGPQGAVGPQGPAGADGTDGIPLVCAMDQLAVYGALGWQCIDQSALTVTQTPAGAVYRWAVWSTYNQMGGWYLQDVADFFGGVNPSVWGDGNGSVGDMSSDKEVLRTLFTRKGYAGKNALVFADEWVGYSSTNSKHVAALFRIRNTTSNTIDWNVTSHHTSYGTWGETASIGVNGTEIWRSGAHVYAYSAPVVNAIPIPPGQTSTVIFVSGSTPQNNSRGLVLAFSNDSLELPVGLEYVDDLDTATGGWDQ